MKTVPATRRILQGTRSSNDPRGVTTTNAKSAESDDRAHDLRITTPAEIHVVLLSLQTDRVMAEVMK